MLLRRLRRGQDHRGDHLIPPEGHQLLQQAHVDLPTEHRGDLVADGPLHGALRGDALADGALNQAEDAPSRLVGRRGDHQEVAHLRGHGDVEVELRIGRALEEPVSFKRHHLEVARGRFNGVKAVSRPLGARNVPSACSRGTVPGR